VCARSHPSIHPNCAKRHGQSHEGRDEWRSDLHVLTALGESAQCDVCAVQRQVLLLVSPHIPQGRRLSFFSDAKAFFPGAVACLLTGAEPSVHSPLLSARRSGAPPYFAENDCMAVHTVLSCVRTVCIFLFWHCSLSSFVPPPWQGKKLIPAVEDSQGIHPPREVRTLGRD